MKEKAFRFATSSQCAINLYASSTSLFCEYVYVFFFRYYSFDYYFDENKWQT